MGGGSLAHVRLRTVRGHVLAQNTQYVSTLCEYSMYILLSETHPWYSRSLDVKQVSLLFIRQKMMIVYIQTRSYFQLCFLKNVVLYYESAEKKLGVWIQ